jgi:hypothetical protein
MGQLVTRNKKNQITTITKQGEPYEQYKSNIKPLDLVFFKGGDAVSNFIRYMTKKDYDKSDNKSENKIHNIKPDAFSHIGMIVTSDILDEVTVGLNLKLEKGKLYVFESTMSGTLTDGVKNLEGESFFGVQIRDFDQVMSSYDKDKNTAIAIGHLNQSIDYDTIKPIFTSLFNKYNGTMYDANFYSLFSTLNMCSCIRSRRDEAEYLLRSTQWLFCSELIATIYRELQLIPESVNPKNVVPMDFLGFDSEHDVSERVPVIVSTPVVITITCSKYNAMQ